MGRSSGGSRVNFGLLPTLGSAQLRGAVLGASRQHPTGSQFSGSEKSAGEEEDRDPVSEGRGYDAALHSQESADKALPQHERE